MTPDRPETRPDTLAILAGLRKGLDDVVGTLEADVIREGRAERAASRGTPPPADTDLPFTDLPPTPREAADALVEAAEAVGFTAGSHNRLYEAADAYRAAVRDNEPPEAVCSFCNGGGLMPDAICPSCDEPEGDPLMPCGCEPGPGACRCKGPKADPWLDGDGAEMAEDVDDEVFEALLALRLALADLVKCGEPFVEFAQNLGGGSEAGERFARATANAVEVLASLDDHR